MLRKFIFPGFLGFLILLASCTTNKKLESAQGQIEQLQGKNARLEQDNHDLKQQAAEQDSRYKSLAADFDSYKSSCEAKEKKLEVVQAALTEEADNLEKLQKKLEEALADFKEKGVEVYYKNGLVYVSMADNLLYKSGSSQLGQEGKEALADLAGVLNDYPKLKVIVLGNTDDVPAKKGTDNWTLSTERANGVVRILRDMYSVDPSRLTAAGKGKYNPVADNSTVEGRAKNRRTDIILNPDLERLWNSVKEK